MTLVKLEQSPNTYQTRYSFMFPKVGRGKKRAGIHGLKPIRPRLVRVLENALKVFFLFQNCWIFELVQSAAC